jgi:hypothetical protein
VPLGLRLHPRTCIYQVQGISSGHLVDCYEVRADTFGSLFFLPLRDRKSRVSLRLADFEYRSVIFAFPFRQHLLLHYPVCLLYADGGVTGGYVSFLPWRFRYKLLEIRGALCAI